MKPSLKVTLVAGGLLAACMLCSAVLLRQVDRMRSATGLQEVLYISSPTALKRLSLGYDGLLADIYWTRAVQYFGSKHYAGAQHYDLLAPLLEITTALDPHLTVAYEFGANFLAPKPPNGAGQPQRAVELSEFGIHNNPEDWRLYYDLGFIYYMELKDYKGAADVFARGARVAGAHPFLGIMAAQMAQHSGEVRMAQMMWSTTYQSAQDRNVRANAATHLRALQVEQDVTDLENLVAAYRNKTGHLPSSFSDLQAAGLLRDIPLDPFGRAYKLTSDGRVEVSTPDDFPFLTKGTPPGYVAPPPKFLPSD
jgi:tetratricopeptide (TPR) repeat protein